jgi:hypothetical protein
MKLIPLYESLLAAANMISTADGFISRKVGGKSTPATIKGKRLVLPIHEHLSNPKPAEQIIFHPLSENILRGESVVVEDYRNALNVKLNYTIGVLAYQLLTIATSTAEHSKLNPDQLEFLSAVKNADERTLEAFQKLLKAMSVDQTTNAFVSIYLKRGGIVDGKKYSRAGIVSFPFFEELVDSDTVYGVKLRIKDKETLINLMMYIFPSIDEKDHYNRGSDSDVAPFLDSLMKAVMAVASAINDQVNLFADVLEDPEEMMINDDWVETFDNLGVMLPEIRMIPMQAGNEGPAKATEVVRADVRPATTASPLPAALMNTTGYVPPPVYPPAGYVAPGYHPPAPMYPAGPVKTNGGLDFQSVLNSNPALNAAVGHVAGMPPQFVQDNTPAWARGNLPSNNGGYSNAFGQPNFGQPNYRPGSI